MFVPAMMPVMAGKRMPNTIWNVTAVSPLVTPSSKSGHMLACRVARDGP